MTEDSKPGVVVHWTENVRYYAVMDLDEARKAFGLIGTDDRDMMHVMTLLARNAVSAVDPVNNETLHEWAEPGGIILAGNILVQAATVRKTAKPSEHVPVYHFEEVREG